MTIVASQEKPWPVNVVAVKVLNYLISRITTVYPYSSPTISKNFKVPD